MSFSERPLALSTDFISIVRKSHPSRKEKFVIKDYFFTVDPISQNITKKQFLAELLWIIKFSIQPAITLD